MNKKILLFLVEGLSDKDALEPILSELVDSTKIHFEVLRCDLTASLDSEVRNLNIKQRITKVIKSFLENNHGIKKNILKKSYFYQIVMDDILTIHIFTFQKMILHFAMKMMVFIPTVQMMQLIEMKENLEI